MFWDWGFRWMFSGLGYIFLFWVFLLYRHRPDNEPILWFKVAWILGCKVSV